MGSMEKLVLEGNTRITNMSVDNGFDGDKDLWIFIESHGDAIGFYLTKPQVEALANHLLNVLDEEEK